MSVNIHKLLVTSTICLTSLFLFFAPSQSLAEPNNTKTINSEEITALAETLRQLQYQMSKIQNQLNKIEANYGQRFNEIQVNITTLKGKVDEYQAALPDENEKSAILKERSIGEELIFGNNSPTVDSLSGSVDSIDTVGNQDNSLLGRIQNMNPEISVLGDFNGIYASSSANEDRNRFNFREIELAFQSPIDSYARADFFMSIHNHTHAESEEHHHETPSMALEEGYITLLSLPGGFQSKIGKFKGAIGLLNRVHTPELPQFDQPNVISNFFGEEGLIETGINISRILPTPWYSQLEFEVANGSNEVLLGYNRLTKPLLTSHLTNFLNLTDNSLLRVGLSGALGAREEEKFSGRYTGIQGIDLTYRWNKPELNKSLTWQTELLTAQLEGAANGKDNFYGLYSFLEYQPSSKWSLGIRFDNSQVPLISNITEYAISPYINFWQSEFGRTRLQYKHTFGNSNISSNQVFLQYTFNMGSHNHNLF